MQTIKEKIKQRRRQMLIHSYLYYEKNVNIISDTKWSNWATELAQLQRDYPEESKQVEFYSMFQDWNGSSGAFLKFGEKIRYLGDCLYYRCRFNYDEWRKLYGDSKSVEVKPIKRKKESGARSLF